MTPTQQLADIKLGGKLNERVATARANGDSWQTIARAIFVETGFVITDEALRRWYPEAS